MKELSFIRKHKLILGLFLCAGILSAGPVYSFLIKAEEVMLKDVGGYFVPNDAGIKTVESALQVLGAGGGGIGLESDPIFVNWLDSDPLDGFVTGTPWTSEGYLTSEADPIVKAITGIVKSNGTTISAAVAGTDYQTPLTADTHYLTPTTAASTYQPAGSYLTSESDPKISTLTNGKWCITNGSVITCNVDPVTDTNTTYSASGTLLQLIGTAFSVDEGTLTNGKGCKFVSGTGLVCDQDYLTSVASDSTWTGHNSYPAACSAGQYVSAIGDTLTCSAPTDNNTTYTASGTLLQLIGTAFSVKEGTLTNGKFCTYSTTSGLVCNSDANNYSLPTATDSVLGGIKVGSGLSITEGVLSATGGGYTNLTSFVDQTNWRLFYSDGSGDVKELALGSDGEYLKSNGTTAAPSWGTPTGGAHDAVTLAGEDYLSLATQQITALPIKGANINWSSIENISDLNINWTNFNVPSGSINWDAFPNEQGYITPGDINWTLIDEDVLTGINWTHYENVAVNWGDIPIIQSAGINWTDVEALTPITEAMIGDLGTYLTSVNWDDAIGGINWAVLDEVDLSGVNWDDYGYTLPTATDSVLGGVKVGSGLAISEGVLSTSAASTSAAGIVELAIASEVNTGTSATLAVTPDSLAGSNFGKRIVSIKLTEDGGSALTVGDGKFIYLVPAELNGMNLVGVSAGVSTASSSGLPEFQIHNLTDTQDMLSTTLTIDATEYHSKDATTAAVINTSYDDVATGDRLRIDVDTAGTGTKGVQIDLVFQLP